MNNTKDYLKVKSMAPVINDRRRWRGVLREMRAEERGAQRRLRDLERRAKEQAKLSAIEQARLEVETYENRLDVLLSVHKDQGETWDWHAVAASLAPPPPQKSSHHESWARQRSEVLALKEVSSSQEQDRETEIEQARVQDEEVFQTALREYSDDKAAWERMKDLARRILSGEHKAYIEALVQVSPFNEISNLGSSIDFTVHTAQLLGCVLKVNGRQALPSEVKSLTTTGKVSVKPMPKGRFHEIYQDYACGCVLRVAREVFALLPAETLIVTALVDALDSRTGQTVERPVLSVVILRAVLARLNFDNLDPSAVIENFIHLGDFKASRKSGEFEAISPLTPGDLPPTSSRDADLRDLIANVRALRDELRTEVERLRPRQVVTTPSDGEQL